MRLTVLIAVLLLAGCGAQTGGGPSGSPPGSPPGSPTSGASWTRLPDVPLSPREGPVAAYVGGRVVVIGGYAGPPCPPNADCAVPADADQADGAAYDPATNRWSDITDAPTRVPARAPAAVVGDTLYIVARGDLLAWDSTTDTWSRPQPPLDPSGTLPVADGDRLVLAQETDEHGASPDQVLDTTTGRWSTLPRDPLQPSFDRVLTATPHGLVLTARPMDAHGNPADPALLHAAQLPTGASTWRTLSTLDQLGGGRWTWTGQRLVDPTLGGADGGTVNGYGRIIPYGGRLDPATGTWSALPHAPAENTGGWPVEALDGPRIASQGWLYDDAAGSWSRLPRPGGAPPQPGPAVWAGDTLVVLGGADWNGPMTPGDVWSTGAWARRTGSIAGSPPPGRSTSTTATSGPSTSGPSNGPGPGQYDKDPTDPPLVRPTPIRISPR